MSVYLHSTQNSEEVCLEYSKKNGQEDILQNYCDVTDATSSKTEVIANVDFNMVTLGDNIPEELKVKNEENIGDSTFVKTNIIRGTHETSPFKEAMRGFVLNKLSKKVGSSHILSGITEKIVKKLEEGKENAPSLVANATNEKTQGISQIEEPAAENYSIPCELKSVVANDLLEISSVEEAIECFEEAKSPVSETGINRKTFLKPKIISRSLPSSPAHQAVRRPSIDIDNNSSDSEEKSSVSESFASSASNKLPQNLDIKPPAVSQGNEIELQNMNLNSSKQEMENLMPCIDSVGYPMNAYSGRNENGGSEKSYEFIRYPRRTFHNLKNMFVSLPTPHMFLLASIITHNFNLFTRYRIDFIFDAFLIAYICFTLITMMQRSSLGVPLHATYSNTQLEMTAIDLSEADKVLRGSVKLLKENYDPDKKKFQPTELVNIHIKNNWLKISQPQPKDEDDSCMPYEVYDLGGAKVSLVPKGLTKKRIFNKKYPICITLPSASKRLQSISGTFDQEEKCDFVSLVSHEDGLIETPRYRAIYIFALTNREKESWYQALTKCLKECDTNSTVANPSFCSTSPKFDLTTLSFSSLLEMNSDENLIITEDSSRNEPEIKLVQIETKLSIEFEDYMKIIWENYQRVLHDIDHSMTADASCSLNEKNAEKFNSSCSVEWLNVAIGRLAYDFITQKCWCEEIMVRIQKKLDKIDMPSFVEPLEVTEVFIGTSIPQIHAVSRANVDSFGVWFDFDFTYHGSFHMTLKTRLKIPAEKQMSSGEVPESANIQQSMDGSEASDDDGSGSKRSPKQKFINRIEKWMTHKHFQTVAQSRFVKRYVGDISNMPLTLTVEVNMLKGILALNIPPTPTDRVWYGFRKDPILSLTASPKVGSHEINLSAAVQMIERKLVQAFKKAVVMPNMDDLILPIMFNPVYNE